MGSAAAATAALDRNLDQTQATLNRVENRMRGILATTRDFTVILGQARTALYNLHVVATGWVDAIVRTNAEMERMTFLLANMSDGLTVEERFRDAGDSLDYLFSKAKSAPCSINALTDSFVKMKSSGLDPTKGALDGLTNAVAAFGGTDQVLHRASIAIQQMSGKGVISMEELRQQLGEAVPSAVALMARSMGLSYRELVDKVSKGQVEASTALNKMFGEFERVFGGSSQAMMDTFSGKISVAKTTMIEFAMAVGGFDREAGRFADGGFMSTITNQLQGLIDAMNAPEVALFAKNLGEGLAAIATGANQVVQVLYEYRDVIIAAGKAFLAYFALQAILGTLAGIRGGFVALNTSLVGLVGGLRLVKSNMDLVIISMTLGAQRAATAKEVMTGLGQAAVGVGRGFAAMLGPISAAITVLYVAADAMGLLRDRAREASEASEEFAQGFVTDSGIKKVQDRINEIDDLMNGLAGPGGKIRGYESNVNPVTGLPFREKEWRAEKQKMLELEAERAELEKSLGAAQIERSAQRGERVSQQILRQLDRQTTEVRNAYNKQAVEIQTERDRIANDELLSAEQKAEQDKALNDRYLALVKKFYDDQTGAARNYIAAIEKQKQQLSQGVKITKPVFEFPKGMSPEEQLKALELAANRARERLIEMQGNATRGIEVASGDNKFFAGNDTGITTPQADPIGDMIDSLSRRNAGLQAELEGTGREIAKVEEQIRIWGDSGTAITQQQAELMRGYANSIDAANQRIREQREDQGNLERIGDQLKRQQTTAKELSALLAGGYSEAGAEAALFRMRLDEIVDELHNGSAAARIMADEAERLFSQNRTREFLIGLKSTTDQINASLLQGNAAAQARHDADIARIYEVIDLNQFAGDERMRMEAIVNDYKAARGAQLQRETEGQFRGMLRTWTDTTAAMDQAAAGWMDSFVNALVEGKASFGDFAKAILADIAKIILRAVIANAILSAIGSFGGGTNFAQGVDPGVYSGNINTDFTTGVPDLHNGGKVGEKRSATSRVHAGIFAAAMKYHQGGLVGLKPDERPAILQTGERVLDRSATRAYDRGMAGGMNVQVNIVNEGGQEMQEKSRSQRFDGDSYIIDIVTAAAGQPGKMRTAIKDAARS